MHVYILGSTRTGKSKARRGESKVRIRSNEKPRERRQKKGESFHLNNKVEKCTSNDFKQ
jgi:hypothetical protein